MKYNTILVIFNWSVSLISLSVIVICFQGERLDINVVHNKFTPAGNLTFNTIDIYGLHRHPSDVIVDGSHIKSASQISNVSSIYLVCFRHVEILRKKLDFFLLLRVYLNRFLINKRTVIFQHTESVLILVYFISDYPPLWFSTWRN